MSSLRRKLWHSWWQLQTAYALRRCAKVGPHVRVLGTVWIHGAGAIFVGPRVILDGRSAPIELHALEGAELFLGDGVRLEGGVSIEACEKVTLGARCVIGGFSKIIDNHFHAVQGTRHDRPASMPVSIGEGARLGRRVVVLPGTQVEPGRTVGTGEVLRRRPTPPYGIPRIA